VKIAIGGLKKNVMEEAIKKVDDSIETVITTDIAAVPMLKNGQVDYYFGACESGGGAAISILIGTKSDADILKTNIPNTEITGFEDNANIIQARPAAKNISLTAAGSPKHSEIL